MNRKYYDNVILKIRSVKYAEEHACEELDKLLASLEDKIKKQLINFLKSITKYSELLVNPTDLPSVITWINKVVAKIEGPIVKMNQEYLELLALYTELMAAIAEVSQGLQCNLTIPAAPTTSELTQAATDELNNSNNGGTPT